MNVRKLKSFKELSKGEQDKLVDAFYKDVEETCTRNFAKLQKIWLQYASVILHDMMGLDKDACTLFIGHWRAMYKKNARFDDEVMQKEYLDARIKEIFGNDYPYSFVDKLEEIT